MLGGWETDRKDNQSMSVSQDVNKQSIHADGSVTCRFPHSANLSTYIPYIQEGEGLIFTWPRVWSNIIPLQVPTFFCVHLIGLFVSLKELSF